MYHRQTGHFVVSYESKKDSGTKAACPPEVTLQREFSHKFARPAFRVNRRDAVQAVGRDTQHSSRPASLCKVLRPCSGAGSWPHLAHPQGPSGRTENFGTPTDRISHGARTSIVRHDLRYEVWRRQPFILRLQ